MARQITAITRCLRRPIPRLAAGRSCAAGPLLVSLLAFGCSDGGGGSPTAPNCIQLGGQYLYAWEMPACGDAARGNGSVQFVQSGCNATIVVPGLGTFMGQLGTEEAGRRTFNLDFDDAAPGAGTTCADFVSTEANLSRTSIQINFGQSAPVGCCRQGKLLMTR